MTRIILSIIFFVSSQALAQGNNPGLGLDLGGGYYLPGLADGGGRRLAEVKTDLGATLDCASLNWQTEFKSLLNLDLAQSDLKSIGMNAMAGAAKYVANSMMPTWAETLQQTLQNAKASLDMIKRDCSSIEQQLTRNDPLALVEKRKRAEKIAKASRDGSSIDKAMHAMNEGFDWSLYEAVDSSGMDKKAAGFIKAFLGDVKFHAGGDGRRMNKQLVNTANVDWAYVTLFRDIFDRLNQRLSPRPDNVEFCDTPMFVDIFDKNALARARQVAARFVSGKGKGQRQKGQQRANVQAADKVLVGLLADTSRPAAERILDIARYKLFHRVVPEISCRAMADYALLSSDQTVYLFRMVASRLAMDGLEMARADLKTIMAQFNNMSANKEMVQAASDGLTALDQQLAAIRAATKSAVETNRARFLRTRRRELTPEIAREGLRRREAIRSYASGAPPTVTGM